MATSKLSNIALSLSIILVLCKRSLDFYDITMKHNKNYLILFRNSEAKEKSNSLKQCKKYDILSTSFRR